MTLVRPEAPCDSVAIRDLTARAFRDMPFSDGTEPALIGALREAGALALSLVAVDGERIVGHVAFSPARPAESGWLALGPISVEPALQRRGMGSRLVADGLAAVRDLGARGCMLLGDPGYYARFGFAARPDIAPLGLPASHFQVIAWAGEAPAGLRFHEAFGIIE